MRYLAPLLFLLTGCAQDDTRALAAYLVDGGYSDLDIAYVANGMSIAQVNELRATRENAEGMGRAAGYWMQDHPGAPLPPYLTPAMVGTPVSCTLSPLGRDVSMECY